MKNKKSTFIPKQIRNFTNYLSVVKGLSKLTIKGYELDLILFAKYTIAIEDCLDDVNGADLKKFNDSFIKQISIEDIYGFINYLEEERDNTAKTRSRKISSLKTFYKYLVNRAKIIDENIVADLEKPKLAKTLPVHLSVKEAEKLVKKIKGRNSVRDRCIIIVFLTTGIRLSELCGINLSDIKDGILTVTGKGSKQRNIPLSKTCMKEVKDYIKLYRSQKIDLLSDEEALFISERKQRINKRTVEHIVAKAIKDSKLSKDYSVHKLRHTAATMLFKSGADIRSIQALLGHSSLDTTQLYTHVDNKELQNIIKLNPLKFKK